MVNKKQTADLIPYKLESGQILVYLQKRTADAPILPGQFSFFGGHMELNEKPEDAMIREIQEELCFKPQNYEFLGRFEYPDWICHMYMEKVWENFENDIKVMEGEYGKFLSPKEVLN